MQSIRPLRLARRRAALSTCAFALTIGVAAAAGCGLGDRGGREEAPARAAMALEASAPIGLEGFGPRDPAHGYPFWFADRTGTRLSLCVPPDPRCLATEPPFDPAAPVRFPANFPDETFYFAAETTAEGTAGEQVLVVLALESAFLSAAPQDGQRVVFGRVRIRADLPVAGTYRVTHPYGQDTFEVTEPGRRAINFTEDVDPVAEDFGGALASRIGPFLSWDPARGGAAPAGYLGDPAIDHAVVGSPYGTNFVKLERQTESGWVEVAQNDLFRVAGKLATFEPSAAPKGGTHGFAHPVTLAASEEGAKVLYTLDGSDPAETEGGATLLYVAPIELEGARTTIAFRAIASNGTSSPIRRETYVVDPALLAVQAAPAGGVYGEPQSIVLESNDPSTTIVYTTDGRDPTGPAGIVYGGPIPLGRDGDHPLKFAARRADGTFGAIETEHYSIRTRKLAVSPTRNAAGYPEWYEDAHGLRLAHCLDAADPLCPALGTVAPGGPAIPDESFWWSGDATVALPGGSLDLVLALEAAFASDPPALGKQISFGRVRLRASGLATGRYRVTHPYGVEVFEVDASVPGRSINFTEDVGIRTNDFEGARSSRIGPFLYWDPTSGPSAPLGYVGDPAVAHRVLGSPLGTNFVRVEVEQTDGSWAPIGETDQFRVAGKLAAPAALIAPAGGTFAGPTVVTAAATAPGAVLRFTTNGTPPTASSPIAGAAITVAQTSTLRLSTFVGGVATANQSFSFVIGDGPTASPAGRVFVDPPTITVSAPAGATLFVTLDGTDPRTSASRFVPSGPIALLESTTLRASTFRAGVWSEPKTEVYVVTRPRPLPGEPVDPNPQIGSLRGVRVPEPSNLGRFVKDRQAAIALGKALFWDMQVGSDGVTACASCHFAAGADNRSKNQVSPGLLRMNPHVGGEPVETTIPSRTGNPDKTFQLAGPNAQLKVSDFPLHKLVDPKNRKSTVLSSVNDVVSSQGVFPGRFVALFPSGGVEDVKYEPDGVFQIGTTLTRRVEPRNAPTVIGAVFNHRNFWDGRAQAEFNGVNPFGSRDPNARVARLDGKKDVEMVRVSLDHASLASQAVGPVLSSFEMSGDGRTFPSVGAKIGAALKTKGKKLSGLIPLAGQMVSKDDSVLGAYAAVGSSGNGNGNGNKPAAVRGGLTISYGDLIKKAFHAEWWDAKNVAIRVADDGSTTVVKKPETQHGPNEFTPLEYNFSLFFGIAVQMYEATLVPDQTPFDRFVAGDARAMTEAEKRGLVVFQTRGKCVNCHGGAEFTNAAWSNVESQRLELMRMGDQRMAVYDNGFYAIGTRPTLEDIGIGGTDPWGKPLSESRLAKLGLFSDRKVTVGPKTRIAADGAFKTPGLRNIDLTAPYFHNGGQLTLRQVVEFYDRGGDFSDQNRANIAPDIRELHLGERDIEDLVAFMKALTDPRVLRRGAPFDHPELFVPNGSAWVGAGLPRDARGCAIDEMVRIPETGAAGGAPLPRFLGVE